MNIKLYEKTLSNLLVLGIFYVCGIVVFLFYRNKLKEITSWNNFNNLIFCYVTFGSFLTVGFLGINYYFADNQTLIKTYKIIEKREIIGSKYNISTKTPAAIIILENKNSKRIEFNKSLKDKLIKSNHINLKLSKGLFGTYIIREKSLDNN